MQNMWLHELKLYISVETDTDRDLQADRQIETDKYEGIIHP